MDEVTELKAAAYDVLVQVEQFQLQLRQINERIAELNAEPVEDLEPVHNGRVTQNPRKRARSVP